MSEEYRFAYLIGSLLLGVVWLLLYYHRRDLRREMIFVGACIGALAPLWAWWFLYDYWTPVYAWFFGLEDFLYGFFAGGVVSVLYEEVYGKRFSRRKIAHSRGVMHLFLIGCAAAIVFNIGFVFSVNPIYAAVASFFVFFAGVGWYRADLILDGLASGILFTLLTFFIFLVFMRLFPGIIETWWHLDNLSGLRIRGLPVEELLWAFGMGMAAGPLYEFVSGRRLVQS